MLQIHIGFLRRTETAIILKGDWIGISVLSTWLLTKIATPRMQFFCVERIVAFKFIFEFFLQLIVVCLIYLHIKQVILTLMKKILNWVSFKFITVELGSLGISS